MAYTRSFFTLLLCIAATRPTHCLWNAFKKNLGFASSDTDRGEKKAAAQQQAEEKKIAAQPVAQTPEQQLFEAALAGDKEAFATTQALIAQGVNINARDENGRTALFLTTVGFEHNTMGSIAIAGLLLEHGATVDATDRQGRTPLITAAQNGHDALVQILISYGANINAQDNDGLTPLAVAVANEHAATVNLLIQAGADPFIKDKKGLTAVSRAAKIDSEAVSNIIETSKDEMETRGLALIDAVKENNIEDVKELLRRKTFIDIQDAQDRTPLYHAYKQNLLPIFELLLQTGANPYIRPINQPSIAHDAAYHGYNSFIDLLIKYKVNLDTISTLNGTTPLHRAISGGRLETVKKLVEAGADIMKKNNLGQTAYDLAELTRLNNYYESPTLNGISAYLKAAEDKYHANQKTQAELQALLAQLHAQLTTLASKL